MYISRCSTYHCIVSIKLWSPVPFSWQTGASPQLLQPRLPQQQQRRRQPKPGHIKGFKERKTQRAVRLVVSVSRWASAQVSSKSDRVGGGWGKDRWTTWPPSTTWRPRSAALTPRQFAAAEYSIIKINIQSIPVQEYKSWSGQVLSWWSGYPGLSAQQGIIPFYVLNNLKLEL